MAVAGSLPFAAAGRRRLLSEGAAHAAAAEDDTAEGSMGLAAQTAGGSRTSLLRRAWHAASLSMLGPIPGVAPAPTLAAGDGALDVGDGTEGVVNSFLLPDQAPGPVPDQAAVAEAAKSAPPASGAAVARAPSACLEHVP